MSKLLDRLATALLTPDELARWQAVRDYRVRYIVVLGSPETPEDRLHSEAAALVEMIALRTVEGVHRGALVARAVPADDPLADPQILKPDALERAVREDAFNIDLEGRRLLRGGKVLMIDLDVQSAPPSEVGVVVGAKARRRNAQNDALLKNKIAAVLVIAKTLWPDRGRRPPTTEIVNELTKRRKAQGFAPDTVRKILSGTYEPAKRLGISLDW